MIGEPDEQWGEGVVAVAALKAGQSLTIEELRDFAGELLARYNLPRRLEIVTALPRNATGKISQVPAAAEVYEAQRRRVMSDIQKSSYTLLVFYQNPPPHGSRREGHCLAPNALRRLSCGQT